MQTPPRQRDAQVSCPQLVQMRPLLQHVTLVLPKQKRPCRFFPTQKLLIDAALKDCDSSTAALLSVAAATAGAATASAGPSTALSSMTALDFATMQAPPLHPDAQVTCP
eukprot:CAMPEP_0177165126 /NCGR_PEP_ID=MMETSP0367-20130122/7327_1 /TAXON_ID=447022 ORGANISM="Scrippsiella hangoei-like, Strain SHHI-4" /NCGR_SAMPLE_ID=MMETSP0367 /ASSEMBLY_ACC=CAM_ASM_000362 /LENGTH=108 /DNA_ID=CAMNT_0018611093 /DNA_START=490 /DNA_END=813 /DNA_ORIENTATION=+